MRSGVYDKLDEYIWIVQRRRAIEKNEGAPMRKRWTVVHEALFWSGVACYSVILLPVAVMLFPVVFVPGLWEGYSCWNNDEGE